ncbi:hypothetical protein ENUP19_0050G0044 [Entamoeba nuttalli]|uniref:DDH domain-containing protein n=2 Tax=Entamoeba nuttalli TaxID=412467 RepID=K2HR74_ENTNP|nr:hypothetical protein ENU1_164290 [Entamoeba nuttalli P19]EKE38500.1 hypothetical protein ENU1_164290 [Entamoeba nuttalli P19]|eukprot:XP_008859164.1 hypothetical protein ENU1_164290 [Entamoeba nuttalli P19]
MNKEMKRGLDECIELGELNLPRINQRWTVCSHGDGDGLCSASIALSSKRFIDADLIITHPMGIVHDIKEIESNLFISDIALDARTYKELYKKFETLIDKGYQVIYIDHHRIYGTPPKGVEMINDENCCASELVHKYFKEKKELKEYVDIYACIGCICDYYDNTQYIKKVMDKFEKRSLFLDAGILAQGLSIYRKKEMKEDLVREFVSGYIPCEIPALVSQAMQVTRNDKIGRNVIINNCCNCKYIAWCLNPPCGKSKSAHFASASKEKAIGLAIFYYQRRKVKEQPLYDLCFRGTNLVDLREIITPLALELGGSGGGHFNAVGSRVPTDLLGLMLYYIDLRVDAYLQTKTYNKLPLPPKDLSNIQYDKSVYDHFIDLKYYFKTQTEE